MIICIDARPLEKNMAGIGKMVKSTLLSQLKVDSENYYLLVSDRDVAFDISRYKNVKIIKYKDKWYCPKSFYYYNCLSQHLKKINIEPDVFWGTQHILPKNLPKNCNKVLTVHDFTHLFYPKTTTIFNRIILRLFFVKSLAQANSIVCDSYNTRTDLISIFNKQIRNKNVSVIYLGGTETKVEKVNLAISDKIRDIVKCRYILFIGTIEPRKNIKLLLEAALRLSSLFHVIICGKIGWESKETIAKLSATPNVTYLNYVAESEKEYLLAHCFCLVQPSLYEGFGLPIVECMQNGSISLVADNSSLKEIVEIPELKFETNSVEDFCEKLNNLNNPDVYSKAVSYCKERAKQFDWNKTADAYYKIFIGQI